MMLLMTWTIHGIDDGTEKLLIMERNIYILAVSLSIAVAAASGCMKSNITPMVGAPIRFGASANFEGTSVNSAKASANFGGAAATKTSYSGEIIDKEDHSIERIDWSEGDLITIYSEQSPEKSAVYAIESHVENGKNSYASVVSAEESGNGLTWGSGTHTFYAAYPSGKTMVTGNEITGEVPSNQTVTTDGKTFSVDMSLAAMWAAASGDPKTSASVRLNFHPMVTAFRFTLYGKKSSSQTLYSITLSSSEGPLAGKMTASVKEDLSGVDYVFSDTSDEITVDLCGAEITNEKSVTFTLLCLPRDITALTAKLETSDGTRSLDFKKSGEWISFQGGTKIDIKDLTVYPPSTYFEGTAKGSFPVKIVKVKGFTPVVTVETVTVTPDESGFFSVELPTLPEGTHYMIDGGNTLTTVTKMPDIISKDESIQKLFYNCTTLVSTCDINTTGITEYLYAFYNCGELQEAPNMDTSSGTSFDQVFRYCKKLRHVPNYDFSNATSVSYTFDNCIALEEIPCFSLGTKKKYMNYTFNCCSSVKELPPLDLSSAKSIDCIFRKCTSIKEIPAYDLSSVYSMSRAFGNCTSVESLPNFNMGTISKEMDYAFEYCSSLKDVSLLDTSHATNLEGIFQYCTSLTEVPVLDYSAAKTMRSAFEGCKSIVSIPEISAPNVTIWRKAFYGCTSLKDVTPFDTSGSTDFQGMFERCSSLQSLPWFDLSSSTNCLYMLDKTPLSYSQGFGALTANLDLSYTYLDRESMVRIFEQAGTVMGKKFTFRSRYADHSLYEKLTEEDIAIATGKGWTMEH